MAQSDSGISSSGCKMHDTHCSLKIITTFRDVHIEKSVHLAKCLSDCVDIKRKISKNA